MKETKFEEMMRRIASMDVGGVFREELEAMRDMPLMSETNEMTFHRMGRRDLAIDLLSMMDTKLEEKTDE